MKTIACVWLPRWPTDRRAARARPSSGARTTSAPPAEPFALIHSTTGGFRLYAVNAAAEAAGLWAGQALADARAAEPGLAVAAAEPKTDREGLHRLARWAERWSPWVRPDTDPDMGEEGADGLILDVSGCARLYGGAEGLAADMAARFKAIGVSAQLALAPSLGLAWGAARFDAHVIRHGWKVITREDMLAALDPLPVAALRLSAETVDGLVSLGLKRVGHVRRQPLTGLVRRFGPLIATRLAQAEGRQDEPVAPLAPEVPLRAQARLVEPIVLADHVKEAGRRVLEDLCALLERTGQGARSVRLYLYRVDGARFSIRAGTAAPCREPDHLMRLLAEKIDRADIDLGFGVDLVEAAAPHAEPFEPAPAGFLGAGETGLGAALDRLVDSLAARLGAKAVRRASFADSHLPERAAGWAAAGDREPRGKPPQSAARTAPPRGSNECSSPLGEVSAKPTKGACLAACAPPRPLLLLDTPEEVDALAETPDGPPRLFRWRRTTHRVTRAEGPERIAPEWWRGGQTETGIGAPTRDYFRVETDAGRRFWLYRAGLYERETATPKWYVHGAGP